MTLARNHILHRVRQALLHRDDSVVQQQTRAMLELADALDQRFNELESKVDSISDRIGFPKR